MRLLITGGGGFIGSHTVVEALCADHEVVVVDDCSNVAPPKNEGLCPPSLERVKTIVGEKLAEKMSFYMGCVTDENLITNIMSGCDVVIHFAGLKAVGESSKKPLEYYTVNVGGTINLLKCMKKVGCRKIIFSSSATVYKPAKVIEDLPFIEGMPTGECSSPYARSKLFVEEIMSDACIAHPDLSCISLRYFNPVGAHKSGLLGEDPLGIPNNLMPYVAQVAVGRLNHLSVFGRDYDTIDGSGVRDYIHVVDLAKGHLAALKALENSGFHQFNLGTGRGTSVIEMVKAFRKASGKEIPTIDCARRAGDVAWMWESN